MMLRTMAHAETDSTKKTILLQKPSLTKLEKILYHALCHFPAALQPLCDIVFDHVIVAIKVSSPNPFLPWFLSCFLCLWILHDFCHRDDSVWNIAFYMREPSIAELRRVWACRMMHSQHSLEVKQAPLTSMVWPMDSLLHCENCRLLGRLPSVALANIM